MVNLFYGNGNCSIESSANVRGLQFRIKGNCEVIDKTSDHFSIIAKNDGIMVFPLSLEGTLNNLFDYEGELEILSVIAVDNNLKGIPVKVKKLMDYAEELGVAESITTNSEDLKSTYKVGGLKSKVTMKIKTIPNLHTSGYSGTFYLKSGDPYQGLYHIHLEDNSAMTGADHTDTSEDLYIKQYINNKLIDKLVPTKGRPFKPTGKIVKNRSSY